MRIGYDITPIREQQSGVGNYALFLLQQLVEVSTEHEYLLLSNRAAYPASLCSTANSQAVLRPFPIRTLWMQLVVPSVLRRERAHLCHYTNSVGPILSPCPYVVTIHDMTVSLLPGYHRRREQILVRPLVPFIARRASRIITVSQSARRDIIRLLRIPPERVVVIPEAAGPPFRPTSSAEHQRVRSVYGLHAPYVLYVGTLEPRKNLVRLIQAWDHLRRHGDIPHQLVIVGASGWQHQPIYREVQRLQCSEDIIFTGHVPLRDLPGLYGAADAFAFPSLYEGFGLPVIEAMACGTPVLTSTASALIELAGGAAFPVDAHNIETMSAGLARILTDRQLQAVLRERGLQRASQFSWRDAALQTLQVYQRVGEGAATPSYTSEPRVPVTLR